MKRIGRPTGLALANLRVAGVHGEVAGRVGRGQLARPLRSAARTDLTSPCLSQSRRRGGRLSGAVVRRA